MDRVVVLEFITLQVLFKYFYIAFHRQLAVLMRTKRPSHADHQSDSGTVVTITINQVTSKYKKFLAEKT